MDIRQLTDDFAASPQISVADVAEIAAAGYRTLVCNRHDGEDPGQPDFETIAEAATAAGLKVHFLPVRNPAGITDAVISRTEALLRGAERPILAYCRSGTRSTCIWGLAAAARCDLDAVIGAATDAGYDLRPLVPRMLARRR